MKWRKWKKGCNGDERDRFLRELFMLFILDVRMHLGLIVLIQFHNTLECIEVSLKLLAQSKSNSKGNEECGNSCLWTSTWSR